jgi:molybdopterin-synthase adenylyltransferase
MMDFDSELQSRIKRRKNHQGIEVRVIRDCDLLNLGANQGLKPRQVYLRCLKRGIVPLRYLRNSPSISLGDQITLAESCVAVVGAGGLGGHTIDFLVRLGLGEIRVFDPDRFDETNLNRQVFASHKTLNTFKVQATRDSCRQINPGTDIVPHPVAVRDVDQSALFSGVQVIVDALDSSKDRLAIASIARVIGIPLVHGAVAGFEGRIMTILPGDLSLSKLYGELDEHVSAEDLLGTPALAPALIASFQAMAVLNSLLNKETSAGKMIYIDMNQQSLNVFSM